MKRISEIVLIMCVVAGLTASTTTEKEKSSLCRYQDQILKSDTSGNMHLIKVDSFNLNILPPSSGVQYYRDGIVFLSSSKSEGKMLPGHISFGRINAYYAVIDGSIIGNRKVFSPSTSFPFPCEALTFNSDFKTMYFTKYSVNEGVEKIYQAKYSSDSDAKGVWSVSQKPLDFCTGKSTYSHPTLSVDGKIMIFASNSRGSLGGMDLFMTRNNGEKWAAPLNLGEAINTKSNELFPYLDSENNLYFSSDGLQGYGGYDVFVCKFNGAAWEKPVNLSTPVNTKFDDVAFTVNRKDGKSAFYTVKQKSGKRSLQLYMVTINSNNAPKNLSNLSQLFTNPGLLKIKLQENITASADEPINKQEVKTAEIPVIKAAVTEPPAQIKPARSKVEPAKAVTSGTSEKKDVVVYRVQFLSSNTAKGSYQITINGKNYSTFEYFYSGGYRTCIGEFSTPASAIGLQTICRKSGYSQAFVAAFKNNVRTTDPALFK
jgi:hypothetical protein